MKDNYDDLLPIGSICKIKENKNNFMICGYFCTGNEKIYTYIGVYYPIGLMDENSYIGFSDEHIEKVVFRGFENKKFKSFINGMNNAAKDGNL